MYRLHDESPLMDIVVKKTTIVITAEVPGLKGEDIVIRLFGDKLTLTSKVSPAATFEGKYILMERCHRPLNRTITLPQKIDPDSIKTNLSGGILTIHLSVVKEALSARTIQLL
ncbi:Hsp20/alpha crystallin family protein [candidate division WOR-3 bacterium]|nr:Hsp20/alpha crystallin family protein [candidate division WOR-3 bacterium]